MLSSIAIRKAETLYVFYDAMSKSCTFIDRGLSIDIQYFKFFLRAKIDRVPWNPTSPALPAATTSIDAFANSKNFDISDFEQGFMANAVSHYLAENHNLVARRVYYRPNFIFLGPTY